MAIETLGLPAFQGNEANFVPIPATYLFTRDGVVAIRFVVVNFRCADVTRGYPGSAAPVLRGWRRERDMTADGL